MKISIIECFFLWMFTNIKGFSIPNTFYSKFLDYLLAVCVLHYLSPFYKWGLNDSIKTFLVYKTLFCKRN